MQFRLKFLRKLAVVLLALAALGAAVMLLWNMVMPGLFVGTAQIDYWHALGLLALSRILFGGFYGHHARHGRQHWDKWAALTPEEREQFHKGRCETRHHRGNAGESA
ncbi:membrane protein implicated in regulation of membrane protease activity [Oxalobacteraceae bacterium GrIS 1.11]